MADDDGPELLDLGFVDDRGHDVDLGRPPALRPEVPRRRVLAVGAVAAAAGALAVLQSHRPSPASPALPVAVPFPSPPHGDRRGPPGPPPQVVVTELGRPLLGGPRWDLFGLGFSSVVRIELATGRVTETPLGPLGNADLSLVPVHGGVLVHPADYRAGYTVADGRPATLMPSALNGPGPLLPGPDLDHIWVQVGNDEAARMVLATLDGRLTRTSVAVPSYPTFEPVPDGAGYPLFGAVGGFYRGAPAGLQHVTEGMVVAGGPAGWLAVECDDHDRCSAVLIERGGRRREVPGVADPRVPAGVLAPDGRTAAVYVTGAPATLTLTLLDLVSGRRRSVGMTVGEGQGVSSLAWSPDSHWLFAVDATARVLVVDAGTSRARILVGDLPNVRQIALRAAGS
jgi:hypothetical protein